MKRWRRQMRVIILPGMRIVPVACGSVMLVAMLLGALPAVGAERLQIFSDTALSDSTLNDSAPRMVTLHIVHSGFAQSIAVRFATEASAGFTGVWLGDTSAYFLLGESPTDISVHYGACIGPPVVVLSMTYQLFGTSSPCSHLGIGPAPGILNPIALSDGCFEPVACQTGNLQVGCLVSTEPATWGRVKALYRN
jgi:hypothetical protein